MSDWPLTDCPHSWHRRTELESANGPHIFHCVWCDVFGWRKRFRSKPSDPPDPIRPYVDGSKSLERIRAGGNCPAEITARPMSARRGAHGGYVPPGSCGGRR